MTEDITPRTAAGLALLPSVLIGEALADLIKTEESPDYHVNMNVWHHTAPYFDDGGLPHKGACTVCMAGAVMAQTLGASPLRNMAPGHFSEVDGELLNAIDCARCHGWNAMRHYIDNAHALMGFDKPEWPEQAFAMLGALGVQRYNGNGPAFKKTLTHAVVILSDANL